MELLKVKELLCIQKVHMRVILTQEHSLLTDSMARVCTNIMTREIKKIECSTKVIS